VELLGELFKIVWNSYNTTIKSKTIYKFKVFGWNFIQNMCFFATSNAFFFLFREKPLPYQRGGDFINGHCP
jgi:hypothetical protein